MSNVDFNDLVLSDVHVGTETRSLGPSGPRGDYYMSRFIFKPSTNIQHNSNFGKISIYADAPREKKIPTLPFDEDGDLMLERNNADAMVENFEVLTIVHKMATPLANVGQQVWRGALLLSDFLIHHQIMFKDKYCLEFGAGIGICSIIAGMNARCVFCTDIGDSILDICQRNVEQNSHLLHNGADAVRIRQLDWLDKQPNAHQAIQKHNWNCKDFKDLEKVDIFLAADVVYEENLTDGLFETFLRLIGSSSRHSHVMYIAVEKRLNFTIEDRDISCPAHKHFIDRLSRLKNRTHINEDGNKEFQFAVTPIHVTFPQYFDYERVKELELWEIRCDKL